MAILSYVDTAISPADTKSAGSISVTARQPPQRFKKYFAMGILL